MRIIASMVMFFLIACSQYEVARSPAKRISLDKETKSHVSFEGRWKAISQQQTDMLPPINTAIGHCSKKTFACSETIALYYRKNDRTPSGDPYLYLQTHDYRIVEWTPTRITAREEAPVADIEIRISLADSSIERSAKETTARGSTSANPNITRHWILE
jgi:hypothetical protein